MTGSRRNALFLSSALAGLVSLGFAGGANAADQTYQFDIPVESLGQALTDFSRASSQQIVFSEEVTAGKRTQGVHGRYTAGDALKALLSGTNLVIDTNNSGVLAVRSKNVQAASNDGAAASSVETVVVTGSTIPGVAPTASPLQIYSHDDIKATGAVTVDQFFDHITQNSNTLRTNAITGQTGETNEGSINGIDLRGLGVGTTLVLLNGRTLAPASAGRTPDISMIPVAALDRVEILTDGASAIYGSDAVGGVVNFVLKSHFDGAQLSGGFGAATGGVSQQAHVDGTVGRDWGSGSALLSVSYFNQSPLYGSDRSFSSAVPQFEQTPGEKRENVFANVTQQITPAIQVFGEALFSYRGSFTDTVASTLGKAPFQEYRYFNKGNDLFLNGGGRVALTDQINFELDGSYSAGSQNLNLFYYRTPPVLNTNTFSHQNPNVLDITAKLDGILYKLPGGDLRFSLGGGHTDENYRYSTITAVSSSSTVAGSLSRSTEYAFGELYAPIIGPEQNIPGVDSLNIDVAVRYTHYSDFGDNASPKVGIDWSPISDLKVRATFSQSFRAPYLSELDPTLTTYALFPGTVFSKIPAQFGLPTTSNIVQVTGDNPNVGPETAATTTLGLDYNPGFLPGLRASLTYFNIDYSNRIGKPDPTSAALSSPSSFLSLFTVNPTAAQVTAVLTGARNTVNLTSINTANLATVAAATNVLIDERQINLALSREAGMDFNASYKLDSFTFSTQLTQIFHILNQGRPIDPVQHLLNTEGQPVSWRAYNSVGYGDGEWGAQLGMNFTGGYSNTFNIAQPKISPWVTFDFTGSWSPDLPGLAHDTKFTFVMRNVLDSNPPYVGLSSAATTGLIQPIGYDPVNADPTGRFIGIEITKNF